MDKYQIAAVLSEIGVLLELKGENRFKCLAYSNGARTIEMLQEDLGELIAQDRLGDVKGIGDALREKIIELHCKGKLAYHLELKASFPPGLLDCLRVPGLGPKKVKILHEKLQIDSLGGLKLACERGVVSDLDGFGEKTQLKILEGLANMDKYRGSFLFVEASIAAEPILAALKACSVVERVEMAGSMRRKKEVIRDIDFVVSTKDPETVMKLFVSLPQVTQVTNRGPTKSSVMLQIGIQADVRCVTEEEYPFALAYFTGSKEHNIVMRQRAIDRGLKLNEYNLLRMKDQSEKPVPCKDEPALYKALDLSYVEPELREDMGEIKAAETGTLPNLIVEKDIRGTFHCHTNWSDGAHTLEQMARAAMALGWEYLGIADHSKSSVVANGLNEKRLLTQLKEIAELNKKLVDEGLKFQILAGSEVDILADGALDFSDDLLEQLDYTVASVHQGFTADEAKQTARVIKAISNPHITMLGHATGRLLLTREPIKLNLNAVIDAAAAQHKIIEFNTTPARMELDWRWWPQARLKGVMTSINPDAHSMEELAQVRQGIGPARKGWLTKADVLNTRSLAEVKKYLKM